MNINSSGQNNYSIIDALALSTDWVSSVRQTRPVANSALSSFSFKCHHQILRNTFSFIRPMTRNWSSFISQNWNVFWSNSFFHIWSIMPRPIWSSAKNNCYLYLTRLLSKLIQLWVIPGVKPAAHRNCFYPKIVNGIFVQFNFTVNSLHHQLAFNLCANWKRLWPSACVWTTNINDLI